ncbi:hypothetical protein OUZ56_022839 [Daphnia magna]|uniref:Uncharacterized protein n=1 Tax=Daphnia magna TaxID=35525 RepID=A0ABR0AXM8_9CRUS|nr:hypothetical protein OUZ56_022839 [Daphnia magna]
MDCVGHLFRKAADDDVIRWRRPVDDAHTHDTNLMNMSQSCYHIRIMATRKRTADANEFGETREHENDFKKKCDISEATRTQLCDGRRLDVGLQPGEREAQQDERTNDEADVLA